MTFPKGFYDPESSAWDRQNHAGALPNIVARHVLRGRFVFWSLKIILANNSDILVVFKRLI